MIQVLIGTNLNRKQITVDPSRTVKDVLQSENIEYSKGGIHLDGESLDANSLNKSFTELGIKDECILVSIIKADGGRC
jgi:sulfur carrier protein ThiS